jgi:hypothetical protein
MANCLKDARSCVVCGLDRTRLGKDGYVARGHLTDGLLDEVEEGRSDCSLRCRRDEQSCRRLKEGELGYPA